MGNYTREKIMELVEEEEVEFIRLQFTDMFGTLKNIAITSGQLEEALDGKCTIDVSAVTGDRGFRERDMYLIPDLDTFAILPWRPQQGKVARFLCDITYPDKRPFEESPRYILKQVLKKAEDMGYTFYADPECEFFLFHTDEDGAPTTVTHEQAGYMDLSPLDLGENARRDMILTLEEMGFEIESSHHELAGGQHEIDFRYAKALETADRLMTFKTTVRSIAKRHGLHATFMPKPKTDSVGSAMHVSFSVFRDGKNLFADESDEAGLSKEAYSFIAGLLKHTKGMMAVTNPLVNSYKRLVPGNDAPTLLVWSEDGRSSLITIPIQEGAEKRIELRVPDGASNPYLVLAVCIAAGLEGIQKEWKVPQKAETREDYKKAERLPDNLKEALLEFEQDTLIRKTLGETFVKRYQEVKWKEWRSYMTQVSDWELREYLHRI